MSATQEALEVLARAPQLALYVKRLQAVLADEARKRQEFYAALSEQEKAEFINGEIVYQSPVKLRHSRASEALFTLISTYVELHDRGYVGHEKLLVSLTRNDYEPDICFFGRAKADQFTADQMHFPAPDLVVEVLSPSTETLDRGVKFADYAAHGVVEYWLVDAEAGVIEQYRLSDDEYQLAIKSDSGVLRSSAIPGFEIPVNAVFDRRIYRKILGEIVAPAAGDAR